jgi:pyruvate,orthophosphate dikinase
MFFEGDRIKAVREMILAEDLEGRKKALKKLLPMQKKDFLGILKAMEGYGVTIRLLDPPLHEFVPNDDAAQQEMAQELGIPVEKVRARVSSLHEFNPMLGHRGCRLGITYPEITEMQAQAIFEAACELKKKNVNVKPEVMVPLVGTVKEFLAQKKIIVDTAEKVMAKMKVKVDYQVGTMIEIPRACVTAGDIAAEAEFFSFGTNDLTQRTIDRNGVGVLVKMGVEKGRAVRKNLKIGICGEHGGDPASVEFCHETGLDYVSCSPFRVPIARLAAAHAALKDPKK